MGKRGKIFVKLYVSENPMYERLDELVLVGNLSLVFCLLVYAKSIYCVKCYMIFFVFPLLLFFLGWCGVFISRQHLFIVLISLEIMLMSINFLLLFSSLLFDDLSGQVYSFFILNIAAAESSLGLAIMVLFYRLSGSIATHILNLLKT